MLNVRGTPPADAAMDRGMIGLLPFAFIPDNRCNAFAATASGLATIGFNGVALTPEYGARQRFICVLTDLDVPANDMTDFDPECSDCRQCLTACPTKALLADQQREYEVGGRVIRLPGLDSLRCDWSKRFGLVGDAGPSLMGSTTDVPPPRPSHWQALKRRWINATICKITSPPSLSHASKCVQPEALAAAPDPGTRNSK